MPFIEQSFTVGSLQGKLYHGEERAEACLFVKRGTAEDFADAFSKMYSK